MIATVGLGVSGFLSRTGVRERIVKSQIRDGDLVERACSGDLDAYRELVERYQQRVQAVAMGIMGNFSDAEDVTQEAFVKAFRNLRSFRRQSSFYTWIYRITYNLAIDEKRKRFRHCETSTDDNEAIDRGMQRASQENTLHVVKESSPDEYLRGLELKGQVDQAMQELSHEHRAVIILREVEGLSYSEISDVVGCSKGTVMSRLHHARKRLQQALNQIFADEDERVAVAMQLSEQ